MSNAVAGPIAVTGATGHLGRLIVESLIERGVAPHDVLATGRNPEKLEALAQLGVRTAAMDHSDPGFVAAGLAGVGRLILVSGSEIGVRVRQHSNVIDAAKAAGVGRIVYTSAPKADASTSALGLDHKATEEYLKASGVDFTILRNNWYNENYAPVLQQAAATGVYLASTNDGTVASAARKDYAEAAAAVVSSDGHSNTVYELSGDHAWTGAELAETLSEVLDREVKFHNVTAAVQAEILRDAGLDEGTIGFLTAVDQMIADGDLEKTSDALSRLIGRPTTPILQTLREVAAAGA